MSGVLRLRRRLIGLIGLIPPLLERLGEDGTSYQALAGATGETHRLVMVACRTLATRGLVELLPGERVRLATRARPA